MSAAPTIAIDNPICVALDMPDETQLRAFARTIAPHVGVLKVGLTAFVMNGSDLVAELAASAPVFLDLKLHDIPVQVEGAMRSVAKSGASYTTVHASGGRDMLKAAVDAADGVTVLAVTVLTSLDAEALRSMGYDTTPETTVLRLAEIALDAGVTGLVCSPQEVSAVRARFGPRDTGGPLLVVPGIRTTDAASDDQRRTLPPAAAIEAGADIIVIGRPITAASDPVGAAQAIAKEIA